MLVCLDRDLGDGLLPCESGFVPSLKAAGPYRQTDRQTFIHSIIQASIHSPIPSSESGFVPSLKAAGPYRQTDRTPCIQSFTHPFTSSSLHHPSIHPSTHSLTASHLQFFLCDVSDMYRALQTSAVPWKSCEQALGLCFPGSTDQDAHHA